LDVCGTTISEFLVDNIVFTLQSPLLAFVDIVLLILVIVSTIFQFSKISKTAAWLLVPYISWVCFAAILNYNLWILNK
jgi:tryptophan-rich sensory protein